jgi:DNA-binding NarL/FixJ family response regulator
LVTPADSRHLQSILALPIHSGCLTAEIDETLIHTIRAVANGATSFSRGILETQHKLCIERTTFSIGDHLTESERRVLELLLRGLDNRAIALELHMAQSTVRNYVHEIYHKLGVHSRVELVVQFYGATLTKPS